VSLDGGNPSLTYIKVYTALKKALSIVNKAASHIVHRRNNGSHAFQEKGGSDSQAASLGRWAYSIMQVIYRSNLDPGALTIQVIVFYIQNSGVLFQTVPSTLHKPVFLQKKQRLFNSKQAGYGEFNG
jgi:hypothetical protein